MKSLKEVSIEEDDDREYSSQFIPQIVEWAEKLSTAFTLNQCGRIQNGQQRSPQNSL